MSVLPFLLGNILENPYMEHIEDLIGSEKL